MNTSIRLFFCLILIVVSTSVFSAEPIPNKTIVLTFDDAVKSHRTFVAPLLKAMNFGATFFVTHRWMDDAENFMSWQDIGELHEMGFEIGNHTWTHLDLSMPKAASRLEGELGLIDYQLSQVGVPKPVSFAYPGNAFGPEALSLLKELGYPFARRGVTPEIPYGKMLVGSVFDPSQHHHLLIPTTGDAYPDWTFEFFQEVLSTADEGAAVVLQFHGVPDVAHPWVHTEPELFMKCMQYLKENNYHVMALRDLKPYMPDIPPHDHLLYSRLPDWNEETLEYAPEVVESRENFDVWVENMRLYHHYSWDEIERVLGGYVVQNYMREAVDNKSAKHNKK